MGGKLSEMEGYSEEEKKALLNEIKKAHGMPAEKEDEGIEQKKQKWPNKDNPLLPKEDIEHNRKLVEAAANKELAPLTEKEKQHQYYLKWKEKHGDDHKKKRRSYYAEHKEEELRKAAERYAARKEKAVPKNTGSTSVPKTDFAYPPQGIKARIILDGMTIELFSPDADFVASIIKSMIEED